MAAGAPAGHDRFLGTKVFGSLDGLRAASILAVVWHHTPRVYPDLVLGRRGFLGVDLFFVISGFLIVTLLLRERRRTGQISLRGFYVRRFLRIFPPYYLMLAIVGTVALASPGSTSKVIARDLPFAASYLSNWFPLHSLLGITWSLSVEEQFYLLIPAFMSRVRHAVPVLLGGYVLVNVPAFVQRPEAPWPTGFGLTVFAPILLGVLLAHLLDDARGYRWASRLVGHRLAPLFALALLLVACSHPAADISGWPRIAIHWSMAALVASCVMQERHVLARALALWPVRRIGAVSYGMYLFHLLVRHWADKGLSHLGGASDLALFLATALGAWTIAELSYRQFESRFLALKERFSGNARSRTPVFPAAPAT